MRTAAVAAMVTALAVAITPARADETRYVGASALNLRSAPETTAPMLARWRINQPVTLLRESGRWCEVTAPGGTPRGYVDCSFLVRTPVTVAQIEAEAAEAALALLRGSPSPTTTLPNPLANFRPELDALANAMERHFAFSPSLYTYREYDAFLGQVRSAAGEEAAIKAWLTPRQAQLGNWRQALTLDFAAEPREPLTRGVLGELAATIDRRQAKARARLMGRAVPADVAPSFFQRGRWAEGWVVPGTASAGKPVAGQGVPYQLSFDAAGPWPLAGIVEMAKLQRAAVRATWGALKPEGNELAQVRPGADGRASTLRLDTRLAVWAVTAKGLVPATLRTGQFAGGACASASDATMVEVVVPGRLGQGEKLLAVFGSNAAIDPARVTVKTESRRFLAPLIDLFEGNTLTDRVTMTMDLDGDGVPDLRIVVSTDAAVSEAPGPALRPVGYQTTAGWYANDVFLLEANVDGQWRTLSSYSVSTCT